MSPLYQGNELCFQISSNHQDLILLPTTATPTPTTTPNPHHTYHAPALHGTIPGVPAVGPAPRRRKKPPASSASTPAVMENNVSGQNYERKMMHREIERQRRQEMSTLYASLRSLLPLHFIKGRRSMSDHMSEGVNYIKHLQRRIQELDGRKNQLIMMKKNTTTTLTNNNGLSTSSIAARHSVEVRRCLGGLEIVLASPAEEGRGGSLRLSRAMRLLLEEGVSVVNCVSTGVNRKSFHTLVAEVEEPTSFDTRALKQKLMMIPDSSS